ncbi:hypothetical protein HDV00_002444 [Rhizophlyctis rosea]|nr:hypothetical protein HDV00_002444 [Rhizophlyctis rosea]
MYDAEKPPRRFARLEGLPADDEESLESERETSEKEEKYDEPDEEDEVRMPVENEWRDIDVSLALLKQSKAQMRNNTLCIPKPELEAAGRRGRPYFELSTVDVAEMERRQCKGGWQLCSIQEEYTPPDPAMYQRRSRGSKQLEEDEIGKTEGRKKRNLDGKNEGSERELKSGKSGTVKREELESLRILRLHLERQGAPLVEQYDITPIDEWRDVDSATLRVATWNVNSLRNVLNMAPDQLLRLVEEQRPDVICLQGIRVKPEDLERNR